MAREDWYRNEIWDTDIEVAFRQKLARSRSGRPQYLFIQAGYLSQQYPLAALGLIDEYFETGDDFHVPSAFCVKAAAYCALGRVEESVRAYKQALDWEGVHAGLTTTARIDYPKLVADHRLRKEYDYSLEILTTRFNASDHQFPSIRYAWNGCNALIAEDLGHVVEAQEFAERALRAAAETDSPFRYHRNVGLVDNNSEEFGRRLKRISRPSKLRSLFRLVFRP